MNPNRKRKLTHMALIGSILMLAVFLILYALGQNISLFYTPTQSVLGEAPKHQTIRLGGMVEKGSVVRDGKALLVTFKVTDFKNVVTIRYKGILPDLFREGQGIVAQGQLNDSGFFEAKEILAKHDENYMPPEVRDSLPKDVLASMSKT